MPCAIDQPARAPEVIRIESRGPEGRQEARPVCEDEDEHQSEPVTRHGEEGDGRDGEQRVESRAASRRLHGADRETDQVAERQRQRHEPGGLPPRGAEQCPHRPAFGDTASPIAARETTQPACELRGQGTVEPKGRTLRRAVSPGTDVLQLERNLTALGFGGMTVDREFTSATKAAVKDWQRSVGLHPTGEVRLGRILFLPGPLRVGALRATLGSTSSPAAPIMDTMAALVCGGLARHAGLETIVYCGSTLAGNPALETILRQITTLFGNVPPSAQRAMSISCTPWLPMSPLPKSQNQCQL